MPLELGAAFRPRALVEDVQEPAPPSIEDLRAEQLLVALSNLQDALNTMPAPVVNVAEPDLTAIVNAVTQLNGPATAQEIALAVREVIDPSPQPTIEPVLLELAEALKTLDFRMKGFAQSAGGGGVSDLTSNANRLLGKVTDEVNAALLTTIRDEQVRRTDTLKITTTQIDLVNAGATFFAGGEVTTSAVTPNASLTVINPTGSGYLCYITEWSVYADAAARLAYYLGGTSTGTLLTPVNGIVGGGSGSPIQARMGTGIYTPGTELHAASRVNTNAPILERGRMLRIDPGRSVTLRFIGPGATNVVTFNAGWFIKAL